ncbi:MAG TPA: hypothetical protein DD856_10245 [Sulfobacillus sp.]|nr:hypothetical protein [Sulfobacillus sp.]
MYSLLKESSSCRRTVVIPGAKWLCCPMFFGRVVLALAVYDVGKENPPAGADVIMAFTTD